MSDFNCVLFNRYPTSPAIIAQGLDLDLDSATILYDLCNLDDRKVALIALNELAVTVLRTGGFFIIIQYFYTLYGPPGEVWRSKLTR